VSRWWLMIVGALVLGGLLGTLMLTDPGYVVLSWGDFAIETSLWFGLLALVLMLVAGRILVRVVRGARRGWSTVVSLPGSRRNSKARQLTAQGLLLWAEGDWQTSMRLLRDSASHSEIPLVNLLFAASSAHKLGDAAERDRHLAQAIAAEPGGEFAITLTRAGYLLESGAIDEALALLKLLHARAPKHPMAARMLLDCAQRAGENVLALDLLSSPALRGVVPEAQASEKVRTLWILRLEGETPDVVWAEMPKALQQVEPVVQAYVRRLVSTGHPEQAEAALRTALKQNWSPALVGMYGEIEGGDPAARLRQVESWLSRDEQNADLLLALGRLALRAEDLDKAEHYLNARLRIAPGPEVAGELGRLYLARGDSARAAGLLLQALSPAASEADRQRGA
jgi:HemY protein